MPNKLKIYLIAAILIFFTKIYIKYNKNKLSFKDLLGWSTFCIISCLLIVFDNELVQFVNFIGVKELSNFVYFILFGFILLKLIDLKSEIHTQDKKIRFLIQESGINNVKNNYKR